MQDEKNWTPQVTQDGSFTFFSAQFGETFHSREGAKSEAFEKFAIVTQLAQRARNPLLQSQSLQNQSLQRQPLQHKSLCLLDVCYGLGYNTAAAIETVWAANPDCHIHLCALEIDVTVPQAATKPELIQSWPSEIQTILQDLAFTQCASRPSLDAKIYIGDARSTLPTLKEMGFQADAIFFDPFSPRKCPQLWTIEFFQVVRDCLAPQGVLATYSRSAAVRSAMQLAGFSIGSIPGPESGRSHEWSQGTVAAHPGISLPPLSELEFDHLQTRAGIPYRDPDLQDEQGSILKRHEAEQAASTLPSTSSWRRKWGIH